MPRSDGKNQQRKDRKEMQRQNDIRSSAETQRNAEYPDSQNGGTPEDAIRATSKKRK